MENNKEETGGKQPGEKPAFPMINEVHIVGRLTNAPQVKDYGQDKKRAQFSVAVPRTTRNAEGKREVDYMAVIAWRAMAAQCAGLSKGDAVEVQGRIRTWKDETDRSHWGIDAETFQVLERHRPGATKGAPQQQDLAGV